jgi:hypothetical protein
MHIQIKEKVRVTITILCRLKYREELQVSNISNSRKRKVHNKLQFSCNFKYTPGKEQVENFYFFYIRFKYLGKMLVAVAQPAIVTWFYLLHKFH